jgi:hypothetical protein
MLRDVDGVAAARDRGGATSWVLGTVRRNRHLTGDGEKVAMAIGPTATKLAREGGAVLAYEVSKNPASVRQTRGVFNWRAFVGSFDAVAPQIPWLPLADFRTVGSA